MIPEHEGVWRWKRKDDGREFDLPVYNVIPEDNYLRVYFLGAYYDVANFNKSGEWIAKVSHNPNGHITRQLRGWVHPDDHPASSVRRGKLDR
jgi:hypothetical protein